MQLEQQNNTEKQGYKPHDFAGILSFLGAGVDTIENELFGNSLERKMSK